MTSLERMILEGMVKDYNERVEYLAIKATAKLDVRRGLVMVKDDLGTRFLNREQFDEEIGHI